MFHVKRRQCTVVRPRHRPLSEGTGVRDRRTAVRQRSMALASALGVLHLKLEAKCGWATERGADGSERARMPRGNRCAGLHASRRATCRSCCGELWRTRAPEAGSTPTFSHECYEIPRKHGENRGTEASGAPSRRDTRRDGVIHTPVENRCGGVARTLGGPSARPDFAIGPSHAKLESRPRAARPRRRCST